MATTARPLRTRWKPVRRARYRSRASRKNSPQIGRLLKKFTRKHRYGNALIKHKFPLIFAQLSALQLLSHWLDARHASEFFTTRFDQDAGDCVVVRHRRRPV